MKPGAHIVMRARCHRCGAVEEFEGRLCHERVQMDSAGHSAIQTTIRPPLPVGWEAWGGGEFPCCTACVSLIYDILRVRGSVPEDFFVKKG